MLSNKTRRFSGLSALLIFLAFSFSLSRLAAQDSLAAYREDFNGDGLASSEDVLSMLRLCQENHNHPSLDYNGDGHINMSDAVMLTLNIRNGRLQMVSPALAAWSSPGFGGGGAMFLPTVDPFDPDHVILASDMTGSFVTVDNGATWRNFNLRTRVDDIEFDPSTPGRVYALNTGLYRSDDGGQRWSLIYPTPAQLIEEKMTGDHADQWFYSTEGDKLPEWGYYKVRVDPADPNHLVIAKFPPWMGRIAIIVSHDAGLSWQKMVEIPPSDVLAIFPGAWWGKPEEMTIICVDRAFRFDEASGRLDTLALPQTPVAAAKGGIYGGSEPGSALYVLGTRPYRSEDGGATWTLAAGGLPSGAGFTTLEVCGKSARTVYLACNSVSGNYQFGIFKTTDGGGTWSWVYKADGNSVISANYRSSWMDKSYGPSWRGDPLSLGVSATNADICYATDYGSAYRTLDGGKNWEQVYSNNLPDGTYTSRGLNVTATYGVHFDPFDSLRVLLSCTDIGMFASANGGQSWSHAIYGIPSEWRNTCYWAAFDPEVKGRVWSVWSDAHDLPRQKMMTSGKLAKGGYYGGVALSDDSGVTWKTSNAYMPANTVCTHILLDPASSSSSRTLYVCAFSSGVYKSTDGGKRWNAASNGLGNNRNAWRMVRLPDGTLYLLVARGWESGKVIGGILYRSSDAAANWVPVALPAGYNFPNDLIYDPADPQRLFLCCWPTEDRTVEPWVERHGGLLRSEDGGKSWVQVFDDGAHVYAAALDPVHPSSLIISTFDSGTFRSDDLGESWYRLEGFNFKWGYRPIFDPRNPDMIYMTTFGGGVYYGPAVGVRGAFEDIENDQGFRWQSYRNGAHIKPGL